MINLKCSRCGVELDAEGCVIISPPHVVYSGRVGMVTTIWDKYHICMKCWPDVEQLLVTPQGGVANMVGVCQDILKLDDHISLHESFAKEWEPIVKKASAAITYKGGGTIRP